MPATTRTTTPKSAARESAHPKAITRALHLAEALRQEYDFEQTDERFAELVKKLRDLDARKSVLDPHLRPKRKPVTKAKATKAGARRR